MLGKKAWFCFPWAFFMPELQDLPLRKGPLRGGPGCTTEAPTGPLFDSEHTFLKWTSEIESRGNLRRSPSSLISTEQSRVHFTRWWLWLRVVPPLLFMLIVKWNRGTRLHEIENRMQHKEKSMNKTQTWCRDELLECLSPSGCRSGTRVSYSLRLERCVFTAERFWVCSHPLRSQC